MVGEEVKIVYLEKRREGEFERAIRGRIKEENEKFIVLEREDGEFRIYTRVITRIEKLKPQDFENSEHFDGESYR